MKILLKSAIIVVVLLIQLTLINSITILGLKPDLILVVVVIFSLLKGEKEGTISGFASGLLGYIFYRPLRNKCFGKDSDRFYLWNFKRKNIS